LYNGKPVLLDAYCGAGGAGEGYRRAGWTVIGVDIKHQPRYKCGEFVRGDAVEFIRTYGDQFDAIHASPPCQAHSPLRHVTGKTYVDFIAATREALVATGRPYVIENVEGAPLDGFVSILCGTMFGLATPDGRAEIRRHRLFETSFYLGMVPSHQHRARKVLSVVGHTPVDNTTRTLRRAMTVTGHTAQTNTVRNTVRDTFSVEDARAAMGIDWMGMKDLSQAIPPAYTEFIGKQLLRAVQRAA
jgi:DNA (cytosine-5)-methyltransferase 1